MRRVVAERLLGVDALPSLDAVEAPVTWAVCLAPSVCPGATDATSAAKPADSAPAPAITQRRVQDTRRSAASRSSWAID
jgi:hypothetical protein